MDHEYELYHYGVKGMKWGVRRYQNTDGSLTEAGRKRQAKQYTKELNALDKKAAEATASYIRQDAKFKRYSNKSARYSSKHESNPSERNAKTLAKITKKMTEAGEKRNAFKKTLDDIDSETWKKIADITQSGYSINSKDVVRQTKVGEQYSTIFLGGLLGNAIVITSQGITYGNNYKTHNSKGRTIYQSPWMVKGNKYKVR